MAGKIRPESRGKVKKSRLPVWPPRDLSYLHEIDATEVIDRIERAKEQQQTERQRLRDWRDTNTGFDAQPFISSLDDKQEKFKLDFLRLVVNSMGAAAGAGQADQALRFGLKMEEAGIDGAELQKLLGKLFRVQSSQLLLEDSNLSPEHRNSIVERIIAQEFPVFDGPRTPKEVNVSKGRVLTRPLPRTNKGDGG